MKILDLKRWSYGMDANRKRANEGDTMTDIIEGLVGLINVTFRLFFILQLIRCRYWFLAHLKHIYKFEEKT